MNEDRPASPLAGEGTQRLQALTDGVFSIVMTLLVFNIALPKDGPVVELGRALWELWPHFLTFAISVGLVGIYWSAHNTMFRIIRRSSHALNWLNIMFLAFLSLLPFSTSLIAGYHSDPTALLCYGGNLLLIGLSLMAIWLCATQQRRLVDHDLPAAVVRYGISRIGVSLVGYTAATALAFLSTSISLLIFAILPLLYIIPSAQRAWRKAHGLPATA